MQTFAKELVELQPDVILASTTPVIAALNRETRTLPIVFMVVVDPVGSGFVASLSRPGGNITGFINVEPEMGGKWLEILKQIAPRMSRVATMFNPDTAPGGGAFFLNPFEAAARSLAVEPITVRVRSNAEIEAGITSLGREQAGLVLQSDPSWRSIRKRSFRSQPAIMCLPLGPISPVLPGRAACSHMERISQIFFAAQHPMSIASCAERTRATFRCRCRPSTSW